MTRRFARLAPAALGLALAGCSPESQPTRRILRRNTRRVARPRRSNPYAVNGGGDSTRLLPAVDYRWAYWLGRWAR